MKKYLAVVTLFSLLTSFALAGTSNSASMKIELELRVQEKIRSLLQPVDPNAQILVGIVMRKVSTSLPGFGGNVVQLDTVSQTENIQFDDIERVNVKIVSRLGQMPARVRKMVEEAIGPDLGKRTITYEKYDDETLKSFSDKEIKSTEPLEKIGQVFEETRDRFAEGLPRYSFYAALFAAFLALIGLGILMAVFTVRSTLRDGLVNLAQVARESLNTTKEARSDFENESRAPLNSAAAVAAPRVSGPSLRGDDKTQLVGLTDESLAGLFADAYWCEQDAYASWLWSGFNTQQRRHMLETLSFAPSYSVALMQVTSICDSNHHQHPYYLRPLSLNEVSQKDLFVWLKSHASAWHSLSPMRRSTLSLTISDRLQFQSAPKSAKVVADIRGSVEKREFDHVQDVAVFNDADDLVLLKNPEMIPAKERKFFPTLVWLTLLSPAQCQEIFSRKSAQEVADAWVGPKDLLKRLAPFVGEKKLKLVEDIVLRQPGSRLSAAYSTLVNQAIEKLPVDTKSSRLHAA